MSQKTMIRIIRGRRTPPAIFGMRKEVVPELDGLVALEGVVVLNGELERALKMS